MDCMRLHMVWELWENHLCNVYVKQLLKDRRMTHCQFFSCTTVVDELLCWSIGVSFKAPNCVLVKVMLNRRRPTRDDLALIMYTSGSTGLPKGMRIHLQLTFLYSEIKCMNFELTLKLALSVAFRLFGLMTVHTLLLQVLWSQMVIC